jgi:SAM-dependent methyltransferase
MKNQSLSLKTADHDIIRHHRLIGNGNPIMTDQKSWHDQDQFWGLFEPFLFNEQRQSNAKIEVDNLIKLLDINEGDRVLDLCCGTGRHSLELARRGYAVVGVDRTADYIAKARQMAKGEGLGGEFVLGDMRKFCRPESFDVIINMFGSFGYFEDEADDRRVVANMNASLGPGGRFLIETAGKEIVAKNFQAKDWYEDNDTLVLMERQPTHDWRRIHNRWIVIQEGQRYEYSVSVRSFSAAELSSHFYECGFSTVQVYGDLEGIEYNHEAKRLIVVGTK